MPQIRPLNDELQKIAIEQLNEVPERIPDDIAALKTWIAQQPHLRSRTDDQFLVSFLRGCKYSLEKAKSKIDKYYTLRTKFPHIFNCTDVDDSRFREILRLGVMVTLPVPLGDNGTRIAIFRNGVYSADKYSIEEIMRVTCVIQEIIMLNDDYANINGVVTIVDLANVTAGHLFHMTPGIMKKMSFYSEEGVPLRPKATHFVNTPPGFEQIFNILKPMMSAKQQTRLYVHGAKFDALHKYIPKKYLPHEYGGENGTFKDQIANVDMKVDEFRDSFKENAKYGTDENLRPGKPIDFDSIFGLEGSFRKLNVD